MVIITGTSRGIGKAVAEKYLSEGETVHGIGRTASIEHANYTHHFCDLSSPQETAALHLPQTDEALVFIHNAGMLGKVNRFADLEKEDTSEVMQLNYLAGTALLHQLVRKLKPNQIFTGVFISSGAGKRAIPSWAAYCASKAAVDLFLSTFQAEEEEKPNSTIRVYAFSPGVVDTSMQAQIRNSNKENFSSLERFQELHSGNELLNPGIVAQKLAALIQQRPEKVLWSVSDID